MAMTAQDAAQLGQLLIAAISSGDPNQIKKIADLLAQRGSVDPTQFLASLPASGTLGKVTAPTVDPNMIMAPAGVLPPTTSAGNIVAPQTPTPIPAGATPPITPETPPTMLSKLQEIGKAIKVPAPITPTIPPPINPGLPNQVGTGIGPGLDLAALVKMILGGGAGGGAVTLPPSFGATLLGRA